MARHECCREIETAIFAARTNLPVLDFQTWQVWCVLVALINIMFNNRIGNYLVKAGYKGRLHLE